MPLNGFYQFLANIEIDQNEKPYCYSSTHSKFSRPFHDFIGKYKSNLHKSTNECGKIETNLEIVNAA